MNPLSRFLALTLFVALAVLVAVLAVPAWTGASGDAYSGREISAPTNAAAPSPAPARMVVLSQRLALAIAIIGAALALTLVVSLAARPSRGANSGLPFSAAR